MPTEEVSPSTSCISILHKYDSITHGQTPRASSLEFQFYISTILLRDPLTFETVVEEFQFYISTILFSSFSLTVKCRQISILHKYDSISKLHDLEIV